MLSSLGSGPMLGWSMPGCYWCERCCWWYSRLSTGPSWPGHHDNNDNNNNTRKFEWEIGYYLSGILRGKIGSTINGGLLRMDVSVHFWTLEVKHYMSLKRKPLVYFKTHQCASLVTGTNGSGSGRALLEGEKDMPKLWKWSSKRRGTTTAGSKKVRNVKSRVWLRVKCYKDTQSISSAHLFRHIPAVKWRLAAQLYLALNVCKQKTRKWQKRQGGKRRKTTKRRTGRKQQWAAAAEFCQM